MAPERFEVTLVSAHDLFDADGFGRGKSDAYCVCEVAGIETHSELTRFRSNHVSESLNPVWNHRSELTLPSPGRALLFQVWDKDWGPDELIGKACLPYEQYGSGAPSEADLELVGPRASGTLRIRVAALDLKHAVVGAQPLKSPHSLAPSSPAALSHTAEQPSFLRSSRTGSGRSSSRPAPQLATPPSAATGSSSSSRRPGTAGSARPFACPVVPPAIGLAAPSFGATVHQSFRLQITVRQARGLHGTGPLGKLDPYCVCKLIDGKKRSTLFQTETVNGCLDPVWDHQQIVEVFRPTQALIFEVYDDDSFKSTRVRPDQLLGYVAFAGEDLLGGSRFSWEMPLVDGDGLLFLHIAPTPISLPSDATQASSSAPPAEKLDQVYRLQIAVQSAKGLPDTDIAGKSDPYCVCKLADGNKKSILFQTETVNGCLDPVWNHRGSVDFFKAAQTLVFEVYDDDSLKGVRIRPDPLLGYATLSGMDFLAGGEVNWELPLHDRGGSLVVHVAPKALSLFSHGVQPGNSIAATSVTTTVAPVFEQPAPQTPEAPAVAAAIDEDAVRQAVKDLQCVLEERLSRLERRVERNEVFQNHMAKHCSFPPWRPAGSASEEYGGRVHRSGGGGAWIPARRRCSSVSRCAGGSRFGGRRRRSSSRAQQPSAPPMYTAADIDPLLGSCESFRTMGRPGSAPLARRVQDGACKGSIPLGLWAPNELEW